MKVTQRLEKTLGESAREKLVRFARTLRDNGFVIGFSETSDALRLMTGSTSERVSLLKSVLRTLFCSRHSDWEKFDEIFDAFWLNKGIKSTVRVTAPFNNYPRSVMSDSLKAGRALESKAADHVTRSDEDDASSERGQSKREGASRTEVLSQLDFRHLTNPIDLKTAHELAERLAKRMRYRLTRRMRARHSGKKLDIRRTIHKSIAKGGVPFELAKRKRKDRPLRLVMLLDMSGSMSLYSATFLRFMHGVLSSFKEAEAFGFHTRLVHISPALRERDPQRAVERMRLIAQGAGGGTRIGECLSVFNRWHAKRIIHSRTCVMIVSDGYDTGPAKGIKTEMATLRRRCRRIVWLNPMMGWTGYTPEAAGMQAALPFIDLFAPAHNLVSLQALEPYLARV